MTGGPFFGRFFSPNLLEIGDDMSMIQSTHRDSDTLKSGLMLMMV